MATEFPDKFCVATATPSAAETAQHYISWHSVDAALLDYCAEFDAAKARLDRGHSESDEDFYQAYQRVLRHPAQSVGGLRAKFAVIVKAHPELHDDYPDVVAALSADFSRVA